MVLNQTTLFARIVGKLNKQTHKHTNEKFEYQINYSQYTINTTLKMSFAEMQPTPTKTDIMTLVGTTDAQPCYIWLHLPYGRGRIITGFTSIRQAYVYAEKYIYEANARPFIETPDTDTDDDNIIWTAADGKKWVSPGMSWNWLLSDIYVDIETYNKPKHDQWFCLSTNRHQIIIGLGNNLPPAYRLCMYNHAGFDVEPLDSPDSTIYQPIMPSMMVCANCELIYPNVPHVAWWDRT